MRTSTSNTLTAIYDHWTQASYEVRVRGTQIYLWGSAGVTENITFPKPLLLHIRNDIFGEKIAFGTQVASGAQTPLGTLLAGECVSIPLQGISGVFATWFTSGLESTVACLIRESS